jgi:hypothetical protein
MPTLYPDDVTAYLVVEDFGDLGRAFRETELAEADLDTIVRNMISGEYRDPLRVVAFNAVEGWSRDVSEDVANEVIDRAYDADSTLSTGAKRFVGRHLDIERRPRALSVLRERDAPPRAGLFLFGLPACGDRNVFTGLKTTCRRKTVLAS